MKFFLLIVCALLLFNTSCLKSGAGEISNINTANSEIIPASTPSAPQIKIFTAANLTDYVVRNNAELDKMLAGQRIMVTGAVKSTDHATVELAGTGGGTVTCTGAVFYQEEWKKLNSYFSEFNYKRAPRPTATVSGVYKTSFSPSSFLEDCKVETASK